MMSWYALFRSVLPVLSMLVEGLTDRAEVYFSILLNESETDVSLMGGSIVDLANRVEWAVAAYHYELLDVPLWRLKW